MKVLILDDHALVRDVLSRVLPGLAPGVIVLEVADPASAFVTVEREPDLDLVLLDLALPGMHGLRALRSLRESYPAVSVVVISATADRDSVMRAIDDGALGFIPKSSSNEVLKSALQRVLAGGVFLPPEILGRGDGATPIESTPEPGHKMPSEIGLTQRQAQILAYMMRGESNKLICRALNIAEATVKNQVTAILKALNVTSRTQAVLAVAKLGLVLPRTGQDENRTSPDGPSPIAESRSPARLSNCVNKARSLTGEVGLWSSRTCAARAAAVAAAVVSAVTSIAGTGSPTAARMRAISANPSSPAASRPQACRAADRLAVAPRVPAWTSA